MIQVGEHIGRVTVEGLQDASLGRPRLDRSELSERWRCHCTCGAVMFRSARALMRARHRYADVYGCKRCLSGAPKNLRSQICEATRHDFWLTAWEVCGALYTERHDDAIAYSIAETLALSFGAPRAPPIEDVLGRGARAETTDVISGEPEFARWGTFDDDTLPTLQAIAEELNLTRERVRQIEAMAIQRLRLKFWQQGDRETRARLETRARQGDLPPKRTHRARRRDYCSRERGSAATGSWIGKAGRGRRGYVGRARRITARQARSGTVRRGAVGKRSDANGAAGTDRHGGAAQGAGTERLARLGMARTGLVWCGWRDDDAGHGWATRR
jgi:hypothetical protein